MKGNLEGATVAERLACSPPTKAIRARSPAGSLRISSCGNRVGGFSRGSPVSPTLSFRCCSILATIPLIGSQELQISSLHLLRVGNTTSHRIPTGVVTIYSELKSNYTNNPSNCYPFIANGNAFPSPNEVTIYFPWERTAENETGDQSCSPRGMTTINSSVVELVHRRHVCKSHRSLA
ncbi:hypothetical protein PR048_006978 [Dryococelus australis]|uniref:Uncharacterized protein n=1 Tax=Dryococelus australis TaxID=614101 RepID=A0ABQ9ICF8_9NEOP|nr:hypothetical protein PR048_006978 [Dryococelus australis]